MLSPGERGDGRKVWNAIYSGLPFPVHGDVARVTKFGWECLFFIPSHIHSEGGQQIRWVRGALINWLCPTLCLAQSLTTNPTVLWQLLQVEFHHPITSFCVCYFEILFNCKSFFESQKRCSTMQAVDWLRSTSYLSSNLNFLFWSASRISRTASQTTNFLATWVCLLQLVTMIAAHC